MASFFRMDLEVWGCGQLVGEWECWGGLYGLTLITLVFLLICAVA